MNIVEFERVVRIYPKNVTALRGVTLALPEGTVRVFGLDPWEAQEEVKRDIGYLSENETLPPTVRVKDMTDLCASIYPTWDGAMAADIMERFRLDPRRTMAALSKGQKRQVGLLCAVCHKPRLLVLDEPAGGLDPVARREFLDVVINLLADAGSTVIFSSHILSDLDRIAQRLVILHEGRVLLDRPIDELKEGICRVEVAGAPPGAAAALAAQAGCFHVVEKDGALKVTLQCAPEEATAFLQRALPHAREIRAGNAAALGLEDIFVELTGGRP